MPQSPKPQPIEKDPSKLFERVNESTYVSAFEQLLRMRAAHPSYRDDQLLMRLLCWHIDGEGLPTR